MPSARGHTTPQSYPHVSSNTNSPETLMSSTPPVTPALPQTSLATPNHDSVIKRKFQCLPIRLKFVLEPNVNLDARSTTKALIEQFINHFEPNVKTSSLAKAALKNLFYQHVSPVIRQHSSVINSLNATPVSSPSHANGSTRALHFNKYAHAFDPLFDPNHHTSTKKVLHAAVQHKSPNKALAPLNLIKKPDSIELFKRYVHTAPACCPHFSAIPPVLEASELPGQTKDKLRFALQGHIPDLFILSHVNKFALINIYQHFILGVPDADGDIAQDQVNFFLFDNPSHQHFQSAFASFIAAVSK
ncbi:uncharacterized protein MELLADRAFT_91602 [Melampsora larici-populina 98AG31]|uniref:Uncharacterized protein n=1 Tax=Melampsora larici-populina (strain 98AG31 / pathotype 3-4-7) TaxID=747676 RepID=F4RZM5_MELLP|nr:uncharacterized protein MELLADRAFT_91602 [Melampsora larici-populina 98AG31]EGG02030.1 hypothetical protein MELLADRAFT_91602 [Melampsora larici-populina 98AG31]